MKLQLTTKEQALTLNELGFDWDCDAYYHKDGSTHTDGYTNNSTTADVYIACPTVALAIKWLREVKGIIICVRVYNPILVEDIAYIVDLYDNKKHISSQTVYRNNEFDLAESEGLSAALKYLKDK